MDLRPLEQLEETLARIERTVPDELREIAEELRELGKIFIEKIENLADLVQKLILQRAVEDIRDEDEGAG